MDSSSGTHPEVPTDLFVRRHIGPGDAEVSAMLKLMGFSRLEELVDAVLPRSIRVKKRLELPEAKSEYEMLAEIGTLASRNQVFRSYIGMGYSDCVTPPVIQRNILENPGWYTQYTPYQAEISQGRLEALLNFQTLVMEMTGFAIANASMLDEGTAAAEAMAMCFALKNRDTSGAFFVSELCHPQTIAVVRTRAEPLGIQVIVGDHRAFRFDRPIFGALVQYPATDGAIFDYTKFIEQAHAADARVAMAADLMALALLKPPAELGADIAVGNTQRFGVPLGYGGPHAAFFATRDEFKRTLPGRIVGLSKDVDGKPAARLALQTREQHIRRDKATSNICTSQVLLAIMAAMYATYHGPEGIKAIAERIRRLTAILKQGLTDLGYQVSGEPFFDTLRVDGERALISKVIAEAEIRKINLRRLNDAALCVALDEAVVPGEIDALLAVFAAAAGKKSASKAQDLAKAAVPGLGAHARTSPFLTQEVYNKHHSETEMLRYMTRLQSRDLSLTSSMIPLGSCTMKLNATVEMMPVTWPQFGRMHPFAPVKQAEGYQQLIRSLEKLLAEITGFSAISLQPNAGSQGEYTGLLVIRAYHHSRKDTARDVCLIPRSAHGTNPASAAMAGMRVVVVETDENGNVDLNDLRAKAAEHSKVLSALMITYPSTHGVFEEAITEICEIVHQAGGQVYLDGANMNAQIGLSRPGDYGADVCHLNLHKTFCIPHGGGGPGMGPIGVRAHLAPFLPTHPVVQSGPNSESGQGIGAVSAAPWGSPGILPISWMYIRLMGTDGLTRATQVAILNANYIAQRLSGHYPVLYKGKGGLIAHECIFDLRQLKDTSGIEVEDVAKRLMDYGFHAPTISFPVAGTLMVEPTESESKAELDRFCDAMIAIRKEIAEIESGAQPRDRNVLKNAPHTAMQVTRDVWDRPYSREKAAFPLPWVRENKFWPSVGRINAVLGDRNLICACPPMEAYE
jgi:glycine dehydrogenase